MLIILQGVPGAGKSTRAAQLAASMPGAVICSTDEYFLGADGVYRFRPEQLGEAHAWNVRRAVNAMRCGRTVIVDNTNILRKHVRPYVQAACDLGIVVEFVRVDGGFQSTHNVPDAVVERMRRDMQDLTLASVLAEEPG